MKESFYLRHDYNSRNDEKVLKLRSALGVEGYGIYWMILEKLAESSEGRLRFSDIDSLAYELHVLSERITDVIRSYGLFKISDNFFWSERFMSDLRERNEKSEKARLSVKIRWKNDAVRSKLWRAAQEANKNTNVIQGKERKGKERKGEEDSSKEEGVPPERKYGNEKVNKMLEFLKQVLKVTDFTESQEKQRQFGRHLVQLMEKLEKEEYVRRLQAIVADEFKRKNCGSLRYLYGQIKGFVPIEKPIRKTPSGQIIF